MGYDWPLVCVRTGKSSKMERKWRERAHVTAESGCCSESRPIKQPTCIPVLCVPHFPPMHPQAAPGLFFFSFWGRSFAASSRPIGRRVESYLDISRITALSIETSRSLPNSLVFFSSIFLVFFFVVLYSCFSNKDRDLFMVLPLPSSQSSSPSRKTKLLPSAIFRLFSCYRSAISRPKDFPKQDNCPDFFGSGNDRHPFLVPLFVTPIFFSRPRFLTTDRTS